MLSSARWMPASKLPSGPSLGIEATQHVQIELVHRPAERPPRQRPQDLVRARPLVFRGCRAADEDAPPARRLGFAAGTGAERVGTEGTFDLQALERHSLHVAAPEGETSRSEAGSAPSPRSPPSAS